MYRHPNKQTSELLLEDAEHNLLRLRSPNSFTTTPGLLKQSCRQILTFSEVVLHQFIRSHLNSAVIPQDRPSSTTLRSLFYRHPLIQNFVPAESQLYQYDQALAYKSKLSHKILALFWYTSMPLPARALTYRTFHNKLPTNQYLFIINKQSSPSCSLCKTQIDGPTHFLASCPIRYQIWFEVLSCYYPVIILMGSTIHILSSRLFAYNIFLNFKMAIPIDFLPFFISRTGKSG